MEIENNNNKKKWEKRAKHGTKKNEVF